MYITVADPRSWGGITSLDRMPKTETGFIWFQGELREIREVHQTRNGIQIELYPHKVW